MPPELVELSATIGGQRVRAAISQLGASLQGLWVDDVPVVRGSATAVPAGASGVVLVPWPNRVRGGRWTLDGEPQQLEVTESGPAGGNAIHGLLAATAYTVDRVTEDTLVLSAPIRHPAGYPFDLDTSVEYRLVPDGIAVHHTITNRGDRTAPVALGVHPYVRLGDVPAADLSISIEAERTLLLGDDNLPLRLAAVAGTRYDLRAGVAVSSAPGHACFTGLSESGGRIRMRLASRSASVEVWADDRFRWAQLFITDDFPALGPGDLAIALEPMTAPPDALNSGTDLHWLAPAERWSREWGIALLPTRTAA